MAVDEILKRFEKGEVDSAVASTQVSGLDRPDLSGHDLRRHYDVLMSRMDTDRHHRVTGIDEIVLVERAYYETYLLFCGSRTTEYPYREHVKMALSTRPALSKWYAEFSDEQKASFWQLVGLVQSHM